MKYLLLAGILVGCANPIKRGDSAVDRTERCVLRLVEKNGISPAEAEKTCTNIFRRHLDNIGIKR